MMQKVKAFCETTKSVACHIVFTKSHAYLVAAGTMCAIDIHHGKAEYGMLILVMAFLDLSDGE